MVFSTSSVQLDFTESKYDSPNDHSVIRIKITEIKSWRRNFHAMSLGMIRSGEMQITWTDLSLQDYERTKTTETTRRFAPSNRFPGQLIRSN